MVSFFPLSLLPLAAAGVRSQREPNLTVLLLRMTSRLSSQGRLHPPAYIHDTEYL